MLAAAAMAGAVLIAVPLLVLVTSGEDDSDKVASTGSADTLLGGGDEPPGAFVAATPTAGKTDAAKKNAPDKDGVKEQGDKEVPAPPVPGKEATTKAPSTASPTLGSASTVREKDAVIRKAPSNVPAVLTRVLIKNNTNSTCVDIPGAGSGAPDGRIVQSTCNSHPSDNQLWNVEQRYADAGPGGAPLFQIRNVVDSMCLDLPGYTGVGGGTKVTEYPCNGTTADNQLWWFDKQPDGKFWLRNYASNNQCLDSYDANNSVRNLFIWPCAQESRNNHEWFTTLR
ncbi:ricin-type beta-trefoil lectin domain protein [Streptomyces sp. NPDC004976]